jgi:hypothetical protein
LFFNTFVDGRLKEDFEFGDGLTNIEGRKMEIMELQLVKLRARHDWLDARH